MVEQHGAQAAVVGAEPLADRDGEAHLRAIDDLGGEILAGDLAEEAFALAVGHEGRQRAYETGINERPLEQRRTHL